MESRISEIVKTETVTRHSLSSGGSSLTEEVEETIVRPLGSDDILSKSTTIKRTIDDKTMTFKTLADGSEEEEEERRPVVNARVRVFAVIAVVVVDDDEGDDDVVVVTDDDDDVVVAAVSLGTADLFCVACSLR